MALDTRRRDRRETQYPTRYPGARPPTLPERAEARPTTWEDRSVPSLLRELSGEVADLARLEVELAKTEMSEKVDVFQRGLASMVIGGAFLLAALLTVLWAVNLALTALLAEFMTVEIAVWLSPLILAVVLGLIGWALLSSGKRGIEKEGLTPTQTRDTLRDDRQWAEEKAREVKRDVKEDLRHG